MSALRLSPLDGMTGSRSKRCRQLRQALGSLLTQAPCALTVNKCPRLHPYCCVDWEKKRLEKSGSWKIAKDINNMPDRSALRNKWPRSKYGPSYLFPPASAAFFLPLNILSEVPRAKLNGGLKKKSVNAKPRGGRSFSLASRSLPG